MADRNLYRYGMADPVQLPRATGFAVAQGDLSYWDPAQQSDPFGGSPTPSTTGITGCVKSAASYPAPAGSTLATLQAAFAAQFVGVSGQRWPVTGNVPPVFGGQDGLLRINRGGVYQFDKAAGLAFLPTALVGPDGTATALLPQQVALVSAKSSAIGRVERYAAASDTSVWVRIFTAEFAPLTNA